MKKLEKLGPVLFIEEIEKRKTELEDLVKQLEGKKLKSPEQKLRVSTGKNGIQYYLRTSSKDKNGKYIPKKNLPYIKQLAQMEYEMELLQIAKKELQTIGRFLKKYKDNNTSDLNIKYSRKFQNLITTSTLSENDYKQKWCDIEYKKESFRKENTIYVTKNGIKVRSKSEVIIANVLEEMGIAFRYEYQVKLKHMSVYPDFYCLRVMNRKEIIWEHFGMMDDINYETKALEKIKNYQESGYKLGEDLIFTFETKEMPLTPQFARFMVRKYLI